MLNKFYADINMTLIPRVVSVILAVTILFFYAVTDSVTNAVFAAKKDRNQPHITFSSPDYNLEKIKVDVKGGGEGWSETARWKSKSGGNSVFVHIFAHVSYRKVIMSSHVRPTDQVIYQITAGKTVSLGERGKAEIEAGFYEYQAYSVNEVPCVYIQSYWADRSFGGIDVVRGADASDSIVGNHMLQVVVCDQRKKEIESKDVAEILSSIELRDAYWSPNWFETDTSSAVPGVNSIEATLDSQVIVEPKLDTNLEGVSGTYRSEITGWLRKKIRTNNPKVILIQEGEKITGTIGDSEGEIWGDIKGNIIKFDWTSLGGSYGQGTWTFLPRNNEADGKWSTLYHGAGDWNLVKIK